MKFCVFVALERLSRCRYFWHYQLTVVTVICTYHPSKILCQKILFFVSGDNVERVWSVQLFFGKRRDANKTPLLASISPQGKDNNRSTWVEIKGGGSGRFNAILPSNGSYSLGFERESCPTILGFIKLLLSSFLKIDQGGSCFYPPPPMWAY